MDGLKGNVASFGWEALLALLTKNRLDGTLSIVGPDGSLDVLFQGGLVVVPIPVHPFLGHARDYDCKLANLALSEALSWRAASFVFRPGTLPAGFMARRAIVLKPKRLIQAVELLRYRRKLKKTSAEFERQKRAPLKGDLAQVRLASLVRSLKKHRRTGTLQVISADRSQLEICFRDGRITLSSEPDCERSHVRRVVVDACAWSEGAFRFLPEALHQEPSGVGSRPGEKTQRILMATLEETDEPELRRKPEASRRPTRRKGRSRLKRTSRVRIGRRF